MDAMVILMTVPKHKEAELAAQQILYRQCADDPGMLIAMLPGNDHILDQITEYYTYKSDHCLPANVIETMLEFAFAEEMDE